MGTLYVSDSDNEKTNMFLLREALRNPITKELCAKVIIISQMYEIKHASFGEVIRFLHNCEWEVKMKRKEGSNDN